MRALLVLHVINALMMEDQYANNGVYGSYTGLAFLLPFLVDILQTGFGATAAPL